MAETATSTAKFLFFFAKALEKHFISGHIICVYSQAIEPFQCILRSLEGLPSADNAYTSHFYDSTASTNLVHQFELNNRYVYLAN